MRTEGLSFLHRSWGATCIALQEARRQKVQLAQLPSTSCFNLGSALGAQAHWHGQMLFGSGLCQCAGYTTFPCVHSFCALDSCCFLGAFWYVGAFLSMWVFFFFFLSVIAELLYSERHFFKLFFPCKEDWWILLVKLILALRAQSASEPLHKTCCWADVHGRAHASESSSSHFPVVLPCLLFHIFWACLSGMVELSRCGGQLPVLAGRTLPCFGRRFRPRAQLHLSLHAWSVPPPLALFFFPCASLVGGSSCAC